MSEIEWCTLRLGTVFTGVLASGYNAALIYWFYTVLQNVPSNNEMVLVLQILLEVLMSLAAVHIVISILLIYGAIKEKPDLVMLWVVMYISSCIVVASMFTVGLAFILKKTFLYIIVCNFLFILSIVITQRFYKKMIMNINRERI